MIEVYTKESELMQNYNKVKNALGKKLPEDFSQFYNETNGLKIKAIDEAFFMEESIASIEEMFDRFQLNSELNVNNIGDWETLLEESHPSIIAEVELMDDIDINTKEGMSYFNFFKRLKLLSSINGCPQNIVVDFFDTNCDYRIYFQYYMDLWLLNIDLPQFIKIFKEIGFTGFWFTSFMRPEDQVKSGYKFDNDSKQVILKKFPNFDFKKIGVTR